MDVKYYKWLELEVTHTYFTNNICSVLKLVPAMETSQIFKNYQILQRRQDNTVSFYVGLPEGESLDVLTQFEGISTLNFQVLLEDHLFFNYTDIEFSNEEELLFFSNLNKDASATQLQQSDFTNTNDLVSIKPQSFAVNLDSDDTLLEVKNSDGIVLISEDLSNTEFASYPVNLSNQESGVYQLFLNGALKESFFISPDSIALNTIGVVQLHMDSLKTNYKDGLTYHIDFNAIAAHRKI